MGNFEFTTNAFTGGARGVSRADCGLRTDVQILHPVTSGGGEAPALMSRLPHTDCGVLAAVHEANQPISPLIQMIMRMPGHLGLVSSLFEAIQNILLPHTNALANFDLSQLVGSDLHCGLAGCLPSEHPVIDLSALPQDAHILGTFTDGSANNFHFSQMHFHDVTSTTLQHQALNVSGSIDLSKPQFEGLQKEEASLDVSPTRATDVLSGSALNQVSPGTHLAQVHTIFSQRLLEGVAARGNLPTLATATGNSVTSSCAQPIQSTADLSRDINLAGNLTQARPLPLNASSHIGNGINIGGDSFPRGQYGPSGAVSEVLGGKQLLSMNCQNTDVAPPSPACGSLSDNSIFGSAHGTGNASGGQDSLREGLRARELSLNGSDQAATHVSNTHHFDKGRMRFGRDIAASHRHSSITGNNLTSTAGHKGSFAHSSSTAQNNGLKPQSQESAINQKSSGSTPSKIKEVDQNVAESDGPRPGVGPSTYIVRTADSLWTIAKGQLGEATHWQDLYKLNLGKIGENPDLIHPGTALQMPGESTAVASSHALTGAYLVQNGDNLWNISSKILGSGSRWGELYKLNAVVIGNNPRLILPGQELRLPGADNAGAIAQNNAPMNASSAPPAGPGPGPIADTDAADPTRALSHLARTTGQTATSLPTVTATVSHQPSLSGPGGADAHALDVAPENNPATGRSLSGAKQREIVSSSLAPDFSFLDKKGRL